jgi:hypothetical protein
MGCLCSWNYLRSKIPGDYLYRLFEISLIVLLFVSSSCKKDNEEPSTSDITLSSKKFDPQNFYVMGYSFEYQDYIKTYSSSSEVDIYLIDILNPNGGLSGVQFSTSTSSESIYGFSLDSTFADYLSAEQYYDNYSIAKADEYETITDTVFKYQVYTFRTRKSNYVKFIVKEIRVYTENGIADYIEVDLKYFIQRDGSTDLAEDE